MSTRIRIRIGVLAMLSLAGLLSLARVNLGGPNERQSHEPFEFPAHIEIRGLQGGQQIEVDAINGSRRAIAEAIYAYETPAGRLEVHATYLSDGDGDAFSHATSALELSDVVRPARKHAPEPLILRHSENQVTLTACLLPDGETVTDREEMALILSNRPVTLRGLVSSATGARPRVDERYLWTAMTITTSANEPEKAVELLESAWGEWRTFWARAFPQR